MATDDGFTLKPFRVRVNGFDSHIYYARSRQKALSLAWQDYRSTFDEVTFGQFLGRAKAREETPGERFGEAMMVGEQPGFYVSHNRQYIQFVRPGSDVVLNTHPLDVLPVEARRGTPYANVQEPAP